MASSIILSQRDDSSSSNSTEPKNILVENDEFTPSESDNVVGDIIFHIRADGMSVASGSLDKPCQPNSDGVKFWSGELNSGDTFTVSNITASDTIFIYNPKASNCADGFVGIINPSGDMTLSAYEDAASAYASDSASPSGDMFGGVVGGQATPEQEEPFYMKHLGGIIGVIAAIFIVILLGVGFFCFKAKRKLARQRAMQQEQEMYAPEGGQAPPGAYPEEEEEYEQEGGYYEQQQGGKQYR